ncbi:MAG: hypothetical protein N2C14_21680 [Planctomycetales bacterium]
MPSSLTRFSLIFTALMVLNAGLAHAAPPKKNQGPPDLTTLKDTEFTGKVAAVGPRGLKAPNFGNEIIHLWLLPATIVNVTGTAELSAMKAKLPVRFTGTFDEEGVIAEPLAEMEIYSPRSTDPPLEIAAGAESLIVGQIRSYRDGEFQVVTSEKKRRTLKGKLAEGATITVNISSLQVVRPKNSIKAFGKLWVQTLADKKTKVTHIFLVRLDVTLDEPLTGGKRRK